MCYDNFMYHDNLFARIIPHVSRISLLDINIIYK